MFARIYMRQYANNQFLHNKQTLTVSIITVKGCLTNMTLPHATRFLISRLLQDSFHYLFVLLFRLQADIFCTYRSLLLYKCRRSCRRFPL